MVKVIHRLSTLDSQFCTVYLPRLMFVAELKRFCGGLFLCGCVILAHTAFAAEEIVKGFAESKVAPASNGGEMAMKGFVLQPGFKVEIFAAEPHLANPVAFTVDDQGRFYVAETFRLHAGVTDIRGHMSWLDEELAGTSVEQRVEYMSQNEAKRIADYTKESDRVRLIWDADGDGKADHSTIFADGFNGLAEGLGAGVLA